MSIEQELNELTKSIIESAERGESDSRMISGLLEAYAVLDDYYEEIQDRCYAGGFFDSSVLVRVDGVNIKFGNIDQFAEWLSNELK